MDISAVVNSALDSGVPLGREILAYVDAAVLADRQELPPARAELFEKAGAAVVTAVASVSANFEMMNRILDAVGVPIGGEIALEISSELDLEIPAHLDGS